MKSLRDAKPYEAEEFAEQLRCYLLDGIDVVQDFNTLKKYSKNGITRNDIEIFCDDGIAAFVALAKEAGLLTASYPEIHPIHEQAIEQATKSIMADKRQ